MDGLELLIQDHDKVEMLFVKIETGGKNEKSEALFKQIYQELTIHAVIEEQVFYPALAKFKEMESVLKDSYTEHANAKREMGKIANLDYTSDEWMKLVEKLHKDIKHHVNDEEQKMFPKVRNLMNEQELQELGQELLKAKTSQLNSPILSQPGPLVG